MNLTRYHGVLAPNAKLRSQIVPKSPEDAEAPDDNKDAPCTGAGKRYIPWAKLLKRVFTNSRRFRRYRC